MHNIAVDDHAHKDAKTLCKTLDLTLGEFFKHCVIYVKKTGIDPSKADSESPHKVVKELEKRIGQLVAFIKKQEQEKMNPLLENLIILKHQMEDILKKLPQAERFETAITTGNKAILLLMENHKKEMDLLKQSQQKRDGENNLVLNNLTKALSNLQAGQAGINETIATELGKKNILHRK